MYRLFEIILNDDKRKLKLEKISSPLSTNFGFIIYYSYSRHQEKVKTEALQLTLFAFPTFLIKFAHLTAI